MSESHKATFVPMTLPGYQRLNPGEWTWVTQWLAKPVCFPSVVGLMGTAPDGKGFMVLIDAPGLDLDHSQRGTITGYGSTITATSGDPSDWRLESGEWVRSERFHVVGSEKPLTHQEACDLGTAHLDASGDDAVIVRAPSPDGSPVPETIVKVSRRKAGAA